MKARRSLWLGAALVCAALATSCSGDGAGKRANVQAGNLAPGGDWVGVWFSELYGNLHLVREGNNLTGCWQRPHKDRWGKITGTVTGDLYRFSWTEHTRGLVGPNSSKSGKGYFKYNRQEGETSDDKIVGEIGVGEDEVGDPWDAIKQRNVPANPSEICGTGNSDIQGGDWDKDNKEPGKPESPKPPPP